MACPFIHLEVSALCPRGRYFCASVESATRIYLPPVAQLREWCLTTACGNPDCVHRPTNAESEIRLAS